jgi:hypothetical protein
MIRTSGQDLQSADLEGQFCQVQNPSIERFQTLVIMLPLWAEKKRIEAATVSQSLEHPIITSSHHILPDEHRAGDCSFVREATRRGEPAE